MDDTQASLKQSDGANATRKRRSSILKSQRPPRTPFSEVELYVATPTDTAKNRRVSFSRRTGVAEFITNEATTTWKTFYEEHNKSLETSGNESAANPPRQTIEHIGKRIFDQQFEEVEAVDFGGTLHTNPLKEFQASFNNNMNFTQQIASLECMPEDRQPIAPNSNFELSALTEHSKPFGNEMTVPILEDMTNQISMNFSVIPSVGPSTKCDDLDEIQKDLERPKANVVCPGPVGAGRDFSEYIEVDLNMTHVAIHQDESVMSITDTIKSPKVQEVSKSYIFNKKDKSFNKNIDWANDKENIAINPYLAPKESVNFAINEASDKVLVFDGKRLTTQSVTAKIEQDESKDVNFRQTLLSNNTAVIPQRKTITLNINDDLPNFIENNYLGSTFKPINQQDIETTTMINEINMSITNIIDNCIQIPANTYEGKQETINDVCTNISFTQVLPSNIIDDVRENAKIIDGGLNNKSQNKTILYENFSGDISMTQALPNKIMHLHENKETILHAIEDMNMTKGLPDRLILSKSNTEKRKTIIFDSNTNDISLTQVLPKNINFIGNDDDLINQQLSPSTTNTSKENTENIQNIEKQKTILFENDSCDISMTQVLPTNININKNNIGLMETERSGEVDVKTLNGRESNKIEDGKLLNTGKRKTIIFDSDSCDLSITQALPTNFDFPRSNESFIKKTMVPSNTAQLTETKTEENKEVLGTEKRNTIIYNNDSCNISITEIIPTNINFFKDDSNRSDLYQNKGNSSMENIIPNVTSHSTEKRKTVLFDDESCNVSMTRPIPSNIYLNKGQSVLQTNCDNNEILCNNSVIDLKQNVLSHDIVVNKVSSSIGINKTEINVRDGGSNVKINTNKSYSMCENINLVKESYIPTPDEIELDISKIEKPETIKRKTVFDSADRSIDSAFPETLLQNMGNNVLGNNLKYHNPANIADDIQDFKDLADQDDNQRFQDSLKAKVTNISMTNETLTEKANIQKNLNKSKINTHNVSNLKENEKFNTQPLNAHQSILIYQVKTSEHVEQSKKEGIIMDKSSKDKLLDKSTCEKIIKPSLWNESPIKFFINDSEKFQNNTQEEKVEVTYKTHDTTLAVKESNKYLQPLQPTNKSKPKKSILNELLNMSCESIEDEMEIGVKNKFENFLHNSREITKDNTGIDTVLEDIDNIPNGNSPDNISCDDRIAIQEPINSLDQDNSQTLSQDLLKEKYNTMSKSTNISMTIQNSIQNVSNLLENDKFNTHSLNINKSIIIYQVKQNDVEQTKEDELIIDKSSIELPKESTYEDFIEPCENDQSPKDSQEKLNMSYVTCKSISVIRETCEPSQVENNLKPKKPIINELLNMSCESIEDKTEQSAKNNLENVTFNSGYINKDSTEIKIEGPESNSKESFLIIKSDSDIKLGNPKLSKDCSENIECNKIVEYGLYSRAQCSVEIGKSDSQKNVDIKNSNSNDFNLEDNIQSKLVTVKTITDETENDKLLLKIKSKNNGINDSINNENVDYCEKSTSLKDVDNTKELLEMISDFTDEGKDENNVMADGKNNSATVFVTERRSPVVAVKGNIDLTNKSIIQEPKRISFALRRQSVVITREDLLNNISMAQAGLQSRFESEDSESMDDTAESIPSQEQDQSLKSSRMSNEVVKTLQFEDESVSDTSIRSEVKTSPLKKVAQGHEHIMFENKAKVIPQYLNVTDVTENIKELMHDLVKPTCDRPFDKVLNKNDLSSTCSTQIQTNLTSSSQIDIEELHSSRENKFLISDVVVVDSTNPENIPIMENSTKGKKESKKVTLETSPIPKVLSPKTTNKRIIIFDHHNPLNNILLPSTDFVETHNYEPLDDIQKPTEQKEPIVDNKYDKLRQPEEFNDETSSIKQKSLQSEEIICEKNIQTVKSDISVEGISTDLKDVNVNTLIVMKGNKELLDQSSSLTLADDAAESEFDLNTKHISDCEIAKNSVVKFLYKKESISELGKDSDMICDQEFGTDVDIKPRKRSYSPTKHNSLSNVETTPKPMSKIQKMTNSSIMETTLNNKNSDQTKADDVNETREQTECSDMKNADQNNTLVKKQIETQYVTKPDNDMSNMPQINFLTLARTEVVSLNNLTYVACHKDPSITISEELSSGASKVSSCASKVSSLDWRPEFSSEINSTEQIDVDSNNVVTKINILPFMGVECEWERSGSADTWSFRLLRDRLLLRIRLGHAHHNTLRTYVRADTPIVAVDIDVLQTDEKDNLIAVCVHLAAEAMRYEWSRVCGAVGAAEGGACAEAVPVLLRRCVAVSRLALRWARVMRDSRARLAYDITRDGLITLKVANFPMRCVWEVCMRVSLVADSGRSGAWPRADDVRATAVLALDTPAPAVLQRLADAQPDNWGHAPRTLWKVFKYLKNRTREEELLGL